MGLSTAILSLTLLPFGAEPAVPGVTSLTNPDVKFTEPKEHFVEVCRGGVTAVFADNAAIDQEPIPGHRGGYNGVASLKREGLPPNLFVPAVAGLNLEHIHDGTAAVNKERFEPRVAPMKLRVIDEFTVELHQPPTPNWKLESCGRYRLLPDGAIEYTFECIPRADTFKQGWIGLFWASYIHEPEDKAIHFLGLPAADSFSKPRWLRTLSPQHGVESTHPPGVSIPELKFDPEFSLTLANHPSKYVHSEPWYYGVSHGFAYVQMFRPQDKIWFAQSPTGGGEKNPAWDFQWFIENAKIGQPYGFVMRAALVPYSTREKLEIDVAPHLQALGIRPAP